MKAVIQRVTSASVEVEGEVIGRIGHGLLVLLGVAKDDSEADSRYMIEKIMALRIFADSHGKMNRSLKEAGGSALVVPQFTLIADIRRGRRPGFDAAAPPDIAQPLYERVFTGLQNQGIKTENGRFGAHMRVSLQNDGPVTFILDSKVRANE
ncbi:MAG TPA: D-aminoacyl-tRNA deacylase [Nitrospiraceae bacterium]|nr:D-aminoacyl-tRNA deacylase [Nitrospiraceae bacterium]